MSETKQNFLSRIDTQMEGKIPEIWRIIKWLIMGLVATVPEVGAHYLLQYTVFRAILEAPINAPAFIQPVLELIGLGQGRGYLYTYLISITIGYAVAYVLNRKVTFKSASNIALSTFLYALMVIFTILAGAWIGTTLSNLLVANGWQNLDFIIKPIQMFIPGLWTYPLMRFVIIRPEKTPKEEGEA